MMVPLRVQIEARKKPAIMTDATARIARVGSTAFAPVYVTPVMRAPSLVVREYRSSQ